LAISKRGGSPLVVATTDNPVSGTLTGTRQPQTGDVLVIIHFNDFYALSNMATPTVGGSTTGVTAITNGAADGGTDNAHAKSYTFTVASTGDLTVAATETGSADEEKGLAVYVLSGADTAAPIDGGSAGAAGTAGATAASHVLTGVTPTGTDAFLIGHDNSGGGSSSGTPYGTPGGTEEYDAATGGISYCGWTEQLSASGATGTRTVTPANAISFAGLVIAIKTADGGATPPQKAPIVVPSMAAIRAGNW
jgi:hypothetical protein